MNEDDNDETPTSRFERTAVADGSERHAFLTQDDDEDAPMTLLATHEWRSELENELRARAQPFADIQWPVDFATMPRVDITLGFADEDADITNRMERLLDVINTLFYYTAPLLSRQQNFAFVIGGNVEALALVEWDSGAAMYNTRLIQIELVRRNPENRRALIYERSRATSLFTLVQSDTNPERRLLGLTASAVILQALVQHYVDPTQTLAPRNEPQLYRNILQLRSAFAPDNDFAMARLLQIYLLAPGQLPFIQNLLAATRALLADERGADLSLQLHEAASALIQTAPPGFTIGDVYAMLLALYAASSTQAAPAITPPQQQPLLTKRKHDDSILLTDAAINRMLQLQKTPQKVNSPGQVQEL